MKIKFGDDYESGFVVIVGKPNVGKSTLMNRLVGEKLSIVTPKPQTTRHSIKGILTNEKYQMVFLDTPGWLEPRYELQKHMMNTIDNTIKGADVILFLTDDRFPTDYDVRVCEALKKIKKVPKIAMINKCDLQTPDDLATRIEQLKEAEFDVVGNISAMYDESLTALLESISGFLPLSPPLYDPDDLSDMPTRFFVQEIIREQIFLQFKEEVPYSSSVMVERYEELPNKINILANVWLERKSQKLIFIGTKGDKIKKVTEASERQLYKFLNKRVSLEIWVKIKGDWRKKAGAIKEFGY